MDIKKAYTKIVTLAACTVNVDFTYDDVGGGANPAGPIASIACGLSNLILGLRNLALALSLLFIIIGGIQYVTSAGDPEKANKGRSSITWAIVAMLVALTFWGVLTFLAQAFGLEIINGNSIQLPDSIDLNTSE